ncbi:MAG: tRNA (adenosine(37)-N6)-threonylcarbamoyltransferase complex dimerization subunit type 1 TsaB [Rhodocyclales bacterium]|nr:tRNA (adenosine(37)-N6)-threonylcarbamoyltransferase complex dimerization subunit type 1 TsaB [Rhodocyclales bacterium]
MQFLSLESSTDAGSVALWRDGVVSERHCPPGQPSSATLLPLVSELLAESGVRLVDLDAIAFAAGPGSFTGLRVACGVAQGLAFAHGLPVLPVGTLDAMAQAAAVPRVAVCLDARMNEVYFGLFVDGVAVGAPGVFPPAAVPLPEGGGWVAAGNALTAYPALYDRLAPCVQGMLPDVLPTAAAVAALAAPRLARGEGIDAADAVPVYVRDKVALTVAERLAAGGKA